MATCFRCHRSASIFELGRCLKCGEYICDDTNPPCRCICYENRLSLWPESREYYQLLDRANRGEDVPEQLLSQWEQHFAEFGL